MKINCIQQLEIALEIAIWLRFQQQEFIRQFCMKAFELCQRFREKDGVFLVFGVGSMGVTTLDNFRSVWAFSLMCSWALDLRRVQYKCQGLHSPCPDLVTILIYQIEVEEIQRSKSCYTQFPSSLYLIVSFFQEKYPALQFPTTHTQL